VRLASEDPKACEDVIKKICPFNLKYHTVNGFYKFLVKKNGSSEIENISKIISPKRKIRSLEEFLKLLTPIDIIIMVCKKEPDQSRLLGLECGKDDIPLTIYERDGSLRKAGYYLSSQDEYAPPIARLVPVSDELPHKKR